MRTFLCVARNRSISRAAQELFATQPTVSLRIKRLEAELGFPVFNRSWRGVELTPEGRHILPTIADHLFHFQTAATMHQQRTDHSGTASILDAHARTSSVAVDEWIVGDRTGELIRALGNLETVHLTVTNAARLHAMVAHGVSTHAITYSTHSPHGWVSKETELWTEPLAFVRPRSDDVQSPVTSEKLREYFSARTFILMDDPVFTDHSVITGPMLERIIPAHTTVVDHVAVMASLCALQGNATLVPSGLCARKAAFSHEDVVWTELDWDPMSVVMISSGFEPSEVGSEIEQTMLAWAQSIS